MLEGRLFEVRVGAVTDDVRAEALMRAIIRRFNRCNTALSRPLRLSLTPSHGIVICMIRGNLLSPLLHKGELLVLSLQGVGCTRHYA